MRQKIRPAYRHVVQQQIVRQVMSSQTQRNRGNGGWEASGIFALFSAAAVCGALAQVHLG